MTLHWQILLGMALGAVTGLAANLAGLDGLRWLLDLAEPIGTAFVRLITMVVVPLVASSIVTGVAALGDVRRLGRIGLKTLSYYVATTVAAIVLGLALALMLQPGRAIDPATRETLGAKLSAEAGRVAEATQRTPALKDLLLGIIPRNPVRAAADFDLLGLIFFCLLFGAALCAAGTKPRDAVLDMLDGVQQACVCIIHWVMKLAPYAVFILLAVVTSRFGLDVLGSLLLYVVVVLLGLLVHSGVTLSALLVMLARYNPLGFYRKVSPVLLFAFSTSSSNATLPLSLEVAETKLGVEAGVARFVLPLGATVNMNGTALYQAVATVFLAQLYGISLGASQLVAVVITATLAAVGAAGVPGAGIITLIMVLEAAGLGPVLQTGIALILGVDRLLDMARTAVNVTGDLTCAVFVERSEASRSGVSNLAGDSPR